MPQVIDLRRDDPWQRLFPQLLMNFAMAKMNQKFTKDQTDIQGQRLEQAEKLRLSKDPAISQAEEGKPFDFEYGGTKYKHVPATLGTETVGDTELLVRRRGENVLSATPMPQSKLNPWKITEQGLIYTDPKGGFQIDPRFKKTPGTTIKTSTDAQGNMHVFALGKNAEVVAKKTFKGVGKPAATNNVDKEISRYKTLYNLDDQDATALAYNQVETQKDALGRPVVINKITKKAVPVKQDQIPSIIKTSNENRPFTITDKISRAGTGVISNIKQGFNNMFGWMTEGVPFKETAKNRNAMKTFNHLAITGIVNNPRFPVYEQQTVKNFLPDPDKFFKDPDESVLQLQNLGSFIRAKVEEKQRVISSSNITAKQAASYTEQINDMQSLLGLMGNFGVKQQTTKFETMSPGDISDITDEDIMSWSEEELDAFLQRTQ